jgi:hypothetical protein
MEGLTRLVTESLARYGFASSAEIVSGVASALPTQSAEMEQKESSQSNIGPPAPLPSGF